jgi:hypothetical protein
MEKSELAFMLRKDVYFDHFEMLLLDVENRHSLEIDVCLYDRLPGEIFLALQTVQLNFDDTLLISKPVPRLIGDYHAEIFAGHNPILALAYLIMKAENNEAIVTLEPKEDDDMLLTFNFR